MAPDMFSAFCFYVVLFVGYWLILWLAYEEPEIVLPFATVAFFVFVTLAFYTTGGNAT